MTDVLSTIFVVNKDTLLPLRGAEYRVYSEADAEAVARVWHLFWSSRATRSTSSCERWLLATARAARARAQERRAGNGCGEVQAARCYDLTNPVHLRRLADYIERERW